MKSLLRTALAALVAASLVATAGCAGSNLFESKKTHELRRADAANPAAEMICLWQESEGRGQMGIPTRGFAGQIMFFQRGSNAPCIVDGNVRIVLFDDEVKGSEMGKPLHQYELTSAAWNSHLTGSTLGPAYSVFVPYPGTDYRRAKCALRVVLKQPGCEDVYSDRTVVVLSGPESRGDDLIGLPRTNGNAPLGRRDAAEIINSHFENVHHSRERNGTLDTSTVRSSLLTSRVQQTSGTLGGAPALSDNELRMRELELELIRLRMAEIEKRAVPAADDATVPQVADSLDMALPPEPRRLRLANAQPGTVVHQSQVPVSDETLLIELPTTRGMTRHPLDTGNSAVPTRPAGYAQPAAPAHPLAVQKSIPNGMVTLFPGSDEDVNPNRQSPATAAREATSGTANRLHPLSQHPLSGTASRPDDRFRSGIAPR